MEKVVQLAIKELQAKYNPHTVILYGSVARNEATDTSDIDIACFCDREDEVKDARIFHGIYLDAWIYPTSALEEVPDTALRFADGIAVVDKQGYGKNYIDKVNKKLAKGVDKVSDSDLAHVKAWLNKMLTRAAIDDMEGNYRRTWLQFELLETYFKTRGLWFLGHKKSFSYLESNDPEAYALFRHTYLNPKDHQNLEKLVQYIMGQ
ncbi:nucleotidyltransferase domain-containing protein [Endozoicomonas sp. SM1973]|uniref:Nucleotidyltransferase domain-containing protein n=1 Tax=Spartinivicinus marinus TaxID=2994442 RepID=A0A853I5W9_9GAMM|nr:nucleotidyltransferase domain-containing protein [Spartinivicinus marinus]MCX4027221.1 nucleotidyltransferase domain-containing protein [Spartinivicinus marinus]NYZ66058.1 nucleotidyltransferase domain-containing protein [Spartinivicinus marinus]